MNRYTMRILLALAVFACSAACVQAEFDRFQALIGVDDGCKGRSGEAIFRIEVDGVEVFKSEVMLPGQTPIPVDIPIAGAKELVLNMDDEGDGHGGDWGDWLDARLVDSTTGQFMFLTDLVPEEQFWIPSSRDRNIVQNKLSVDGKTYLRGWGGITGDRMVFKDWGKTTIEKEAAIDKANADAAKKVGALTFKVSTTPPSGLKIALDGNALSADDLLRGVAIGATSVLRITTNPSDPAQVHWWGMDSAAHVIAADGKTVPFVCLIQPSERVMHETQPPPPNQNVLRGKAPAETQGYWNGHPMPPPAETTFDLADLSLRFERAYRPSVQGDGWLAILVKPYKTTETPNPKSVTSAMLTVTVDDEPVAYIFSDNLESWDQNVPLKTWPQKLACVTTAGNDGSLGDGFVIDLGVQLTGMDAPLWLRSIQPSYSHFDYHGANRLLVAGAWELSGSGLVRWDGLSTELDARKAGETELVKAKAAIAKAKNAAEVEAAVQTVLAVDPKQPEVRVVAANRCRELGDLFQERQQWGLMVEESRADLPLIQQAKERMDKIWDELDPEPWVYPDDGAPTRTARALKQSWGDVFVAGVPMDAGRYGGSFDDTSSLEQWQNCNGEFTNRIWTISFPSARPDRGAGTVSGIEYGWTSGLNFTLPTAGRYGIMVNSLGIEVTAKLMADGKMIAEKTTKHPFFDIDLDQAYDASDNPLTLAVTIEPDVTGINLAHTMDVVCWPITSEADLPTEQWDLYINPNGSAEVSRASRAPILAAIPRSAMNLTVEGSAGYTIQEPITEYLIDWDSRLGVGYVPLFAVPAPGQELKVTYHWPDAAYNVPMSKGDWSDRLGRVFLRTASGILDTEKKSIWRITNIPTGWVVDNYTPSPGNKTGNLFEVEPKSALNAVWKAKGVQTAWTALSHDRIRMYVPDNPNNRRWFPTWMKYVGGSYDMQKKATGAERDAWVYIGVQGASMLSGYGGGTMDDKFCPETWIPATERMAPCLWRHGRNVTLVDAHEMHWVFCNSRVPGASSWTDNGYVSWCEEIGWRASGLANCRDAWRDHMSCIGPAKELIKKLGYNPIQIEGDAFNNLPGEQQHLMVALGWYITQQFYEKYGEDFWAKFWREQWARNCDLYPVLSDRAKQIFLIDEIARVSGDPSVKERFQNEWLFDLTPNPQDLPDRFLVLPRQPKVWDQDDPQFASADYDDTGWYVTATPQRGENLGPGPWTEKVSEMVNHRGVAWYRFTFNVPSDFKTENLDLVMGPIEMADETYVNGVKVGATGKFPPDKDASDIARVYRVPDGLVKPGERCVVAVRVFDENGMGIKERPRLISRIGE